MPIYQHDFTSDPNFPRLVYPHPRIPVQHEEGEPLGHATLTENGFEFLDLPLDIVRKLERGECGVRVTSFDVALPQSGGPARDLQVIGIEICPN